MSKQGSLVRLYLYKAVHTLTYSGTGAFYLRIGGDLTAEITDTADIVDSIQSALDTTLGAANYTFAGGSSSPWTITLIEDYAFSGIPFEVASADAGVTVSIARTFPASTADAKTEANGYYKMGAETSLDKNFDIESQNVTSKDSGGFTQTESQIRTIDLSGSNYYISTGYYSALRKQFELLYPVVICDIDPDVNGSSEQLLNFGVYTMTGLQQGSTHNQVVEFSVDFQLTGEPTAVIV